MDLKLFLATFLTVFVAELGDKTQLATFSLSANSNNRMSIFLGSAAALVLASLMGVFLGGTIGQYVSQNTLKYVGGVLFLVMGVVLIIKK
jgi:putative Ca2+/H+ antiporter (TMEM165/GDT1 family)